MSKLPNSPVISQDPMYQLLREGKVEEFNQKKQSGEEFSFTCCDFRSLDLKGLDASGLDLRGAYFRQCDLRGIDFRTALLDGASINGAKISGTFFPETLSAQEILLSLEHGTRMRTNSD